MFQRIWAYIKQLFRSTAEGAMDPAIEVEMAITEARKQDQALRNQAAKVIAHRTQLEQKLEGAADTLGEAREIAKQALLRADKAKNEGDMEAFDKWSRAAQAQALKMQAAENNLNSLREQYEFAQGQALAVHIRPRGDFKYEEKIQGRLAEAKANAELRAATPDGAEAELREAINMASADAQLEALRTELGLNE